MTDDDDSSIGRGGLADQLADVEIDAPDEDEVDERGSDPGSDDGAADEHDTQRTHDGSQADASDESNLSDEELFEQAIAQMSPEEARRAKQPDVVSGASEQRASRTLSDTEEAEELPAQEELPEQDDVDPGEPRPTSERELFEQAISDIGPEDVYRGKFEGRGPSFDDEDDEPDEKQPGLPGQTPTQKTSEPAQTSAADEEEAREKLGELRTMRQFEKAVGPVDRDIDRDKYRDRTQRRDPEKDVERRLSYRSDAPEELTTPPLPKSGEELNNVTLGAEHKDLLERFQKRARRDQVYEINVRGDTVDDALRQVELFVHQQWKEGARFCRIVHGRGLRSSGDPVLKPAILRWLEGPGFRYVRGYAPETNNAGDYGSVVVELPKRRQDK
jgi:DNA-nicking Smr family endonuclease